MIIDLLIRHFMPILPKSINPWNWTWIPKMMGLVFFGISRLQLWPFFSLSVPSFFGGVLLSSDHSQVEGSLKDHGQLKHGSRIEKDQILTADVLNQEKVLASVALSPIIMEVQNYPKSRQAAIGGTHFSLNHDCGRKSQLPERKSHEFGRETSLQFFWAFSALNKLSWDSWKHL